MRERKVSWIIVIMLVIATFVGGFYWTPFIGMTRANPGDVDDAWDNSTTLTVTVESPYPSILWWDFQDSTNASKKDAQVDVNDYCEFKINISNSAGWQDINWVNITAWYDDGDDTNAYNSTAGGNLNMLLQYENTSGTDTFRMCWPDDEVLFNGGTETEINTSCSNLTFTFTPYYQVRHAPGDGGWSSVNNETDDPLSWNFRINVTTSTDKITWVQGEYGIFRYAEINSVGTPSMSAAPGETATASAFNIVTRVNANYSLSVELNATLEGPSSNTMANTTVGAVGGELTEAKFPGTGPLYMFGGASTYTDRDPDNTSRTTSTTFHCDIPYGQFPGAYTSFVYYHLLLE